MLLRVKIAGVVKTPLMPGELSAFIFAAAVSTSELPIGGISSTFILWLLVYTSSLGNNQRRRWYISRGYGACLAVANFSFLRQCWLRYRRSQRRRLLSVPEKSHFCFLGLILWISLASSQTEPLYSNDFCRSCREEKADKSAQNHLRQRTA